MTLEEKKKVFFKWGYGLFIHYGLYSVHGLGEWVMYKERRNVEEYYREALPHFAPKKGCAREWVNHAKRCGMKYAVFTTNHHEGYFLGEELIREFTDACRENGLGVGLYYSVEDWSDPAFSLGPSGKGWPAFVERTHRQIKHIMTQYGKIDYLFYDGCPPPATWGMHELHKEIRAIQPEMLISRCPEDNDLKSCEQHSNGSAINIWESCYTLNDNWGYHKFDDNWKSAEDVIKLLFVNRHNGGNLLLNAGPMADGTIQPEVVSIMEEVGEWLKANGEAVYDIVPHPFDYHDQEFSTGHDNNAYIMLTREFLGPKCKICGVGNKVKKISILGTGEEIAFEQAPEIITLTGLVPQPKGNLPRIIKLELDGAPSGIRNPFRLDPGVKIKTTGE